MDKKKDNLDSIGDINKWAIVPVTIRFPTSIYRRVKALAKNERRSFNAQVIRILEKYLNG